MRLVVLASFLALAGSTPAAAQLKERPPPPVTEEPAPDLDRSAAARQKVFRPWLLDRVPNGPAEPDRKPVDLGPSRLFRTGTPRLIQRRKNEKGLTRFGDAGWKTHAAQVGGMVVGWAALAALCGGNRCMLPKALGSWIPGTTSEAPPAPARGGGPNLRGLPTMHRPRR